MEPIRFLLALLIAWMVLPGPSLAQEEVTTNIYRYREREMSTGYFEEYEAKPRSYQPYVRPPELRNTRIGFSPSAEAVRVRGMLADSHWGIKYYEGRTCVECHREEATDIHTVKAKITCRQCHGGEPISSVHHYYSPMNPIRRHAYVCAKCHEGANVSFATYIVHEPNPASAKTIKTFPLLAYAFWIMVAIGAGTFVVFLPHTFLWGLRELFAKEKKPGELKSKDQN
jgi:hypothetical protein